MDIDREKWYLERISELEGEVSDLESENNDYVSVYESLLRRIAGFKVDLSSSRYIQEHHLKNIRKLNEYISQTLNK
jgi:hypothetical protein